VKILVNEPVRKVPLSERWTHRRRRKPVSLVAPTPAEQVRKPQIDYALVFRERVKQLGDDGLKEESRLRALEAVVGFYRNNHPGIDIDTAKAAVLAAIKEAAP
jgi:hypothetical protein